MTEYQRTPAVYCRDLWLPRQVIGQLQDQALEIGDTFDVGGPSPRCCRPRCPMGRSGPSGHPFLAG